MKGAWRALWERRPRLGHKGRAARNLLLVLALAVLVWGQYGCPMPTAEMAFRQMEGQYLLPRSEIVYQSGFWNTGDIERVESRDGTYLSVFDPFVVGVAQNRVYSVTLDRPGRQVLGVFPLGEGPAPIPINGVIAWVPEPGRTRMSGCNLLFLQIPGETARAELDVDTVLPGGERFLRRAQEGFCLEDGVWLFPLESPEGGWSGDWYEGAAYTLRLYREDGRCSWGRAARCGSPERRRGPGDRVSGARRRERRAALAGCPKRPEEKAGEIGGTPPKNFQNTLDTHGGVVV